MDRGHHFLPSEGVYPKFERAPDVCDDDLHDIFPSLGRLNYASHGVDMPLVRVNMNSVYIKNSGSKDNYRIRKTSKTLRFYLLRTMLFT